MSQRQKLLGYPSLSSRSWVQLNLLDANLPSNTREHTARAAHRGTVWNAALLGLAGVPRWHCLAQGNVFFGVAQPAWHKERGAGCCPLLSLTATPSLRRELGRRAGEKGLGRKLYVILGWLLSNCFNEMECGVFSAAWQKQPFFVFAILGGKQSKLVCFPAALSSSAWICHRGGSRILLSARGRLPWCVCVCVSSCVCNSVCKWLSLVPLWGVNTAVVLKWDQLSFKVPNSDL